MGEPTKCPTCGAPTLARYWPILQHSPPRYTYAPSTLPSDVREALGVAVREMDLMLGMDVCDNADRDEIAAALNVLRAYLKRTEADQ